MICKNAKCALEIQDNFAFCPFCGKKQAAAERKHKKRINGSGSICKHGGNRQKPYESRKNGVSIGTFKTYAEAQRALDRLVDQDVTDNYNLTFAQIYERWKPEHFRLLSKSHQNDYTSAYKHCEPLYSRKFRTLRKSDFVSVIMKMEDAGYSESMIGKVMQLFGSLSKWAMEQTIINQNHAAFLDTAAKQKSTRVPFTDAELQRISDCKLPQAAILRILIATGCRPIDLFSATLDNCGPDYFISGSKSETGRDRCIAVSSYGLSDYQELRLMATIKSGAARLIDGYPGNHVYANWEKREYPELRDALNLGDKTPYYARHTYITKASKSGMPQDILRRQVGHKDIHTTDSVYKHLADTEIITASKSIQIIPAKKPPK